MLEEINMQRTLLAIALASNGILAVTPCFAGDADICYSAPVLVAGGLNNDELKATTPLKCSQTGTHTLIKLAKEGWSIVSILPVSVDHGSGESWMVVIQKVK